MGSNLCSRWVNRTACVLVECKIAEGCRYGEFDGETNAAFEEAVNRHSSVGRPWLLDDDGAVQRCEQCNGQDGRAVEFGPGDPFALAVRRQWAHDAFGEGVCRFVYLCLACDRAIMCHAAGQDEPWFDPWHYGLNPDCDSCRAEAPPGGV